METIGYIFALYGVVTGLIFIAYLLELPYRNEKSILEVIFRITLGFIFGFIVVPLLIGEMLYKNT